MSAQDYVSTYAGHYFDFSEAVPFFLISLAGLCVVIGIILIMARVRAEFDRSHPSGIQDSDLDADGATIEHQDYTDPDCNTKDQERATSARADQDYYTEPYEDQDNTADTDPDADADADAASGIRARNLET